MAAASKIAIRRSSHPTACCSGGPRSDFRVSARRRSRAVRVSCSLRGYLTKQTQRVSAVWPRQSLDRAIDAVDAAAEGVQPTVRLEALADGQIVAVPRQQNKRIYSSSCHSSIRPSTFTRQPSAFRKAGPVSTTIRRPTRYALSIPRRPRHR